MGPGKYVPQPCDVREQARRPNPDPPDSPEGSETSPAPSAVPSVSPTFTPTVSPTSSHSPAEDLHADAQAGSVWAAHPNITAGYCVEGYGCRFQLSCNRLHTEDQLAFFASEDGSRAKRGYKLRPCFYFERGTCNHMDKPSWCPFAHGTDDPRRDVNHRRIGFLSKGQMRGRPAPLDMADADPRSTTGLGAHARYAHSSTAGSASTSNGNDSKPCKVKSNLAGAYSAGLLRCKRTLEEEFFCNTKGRPTLEPPPPIDELTRRIGRELTQLLQIPPHNEMSCSNCCNELYRKCPEIRASLKAANVKICELVKQRKFSGIRMYSDASGKRGAETFKLLTVEAGLPQSAPSGDAASCTTTIAHMPRRWTGFLRSTR
jgi:hypothetical protein